MLVIPTIPDCDFIQDEDAARRLAENLDKREMFALDTETTGLNIMSDRALYVAVAWVGYRGIFSADYLPLFREPLEDPGKIIYLWNAKYDNHMIANASGITMGGMWDGLVMSRMEDTDRRSHSLKDVTSSIFSPREPEYVSYASPFKGKIKSFRDFLEVYGLEAGADYGSLDAWNTWNCCLKLKGRLKKMDAREGKSVWDLFKEEEVPYTQILFKMERRGFQLDVEFLEKASKEAEKECEKAAYAFCKKAGKVINLGSPKQLQTFFYDELGRVPTKLTAKAQKPSVDDEVLRGWLEDNKNDEYANILKTYRKLDKLNGTYLKGLLKRVDSAGRVHTTFNQGGAAATQRLSSARPNLQNIPRPKNDKFKIRSAFVASGGMDLIDNDFDQVEMMLIADFAQETTLLDAIASGRDMHSDGAALMFDIPYEVMVKAVKNVKSNVGTDSDEELEELRTKTKALSFGLNYGEGPKRVAKKLGITERAAQDLIDLYFDTRPLLKDFMEACSAIAEEQGYVQTLSGRWLRLKLALSKNWKVRKSVSKDGTSRVVQGCQDTDDWIETTSGPIRLKNLNPEKDKLYTFNGSTGDYTVYPTGKKPLYRVETTLGSPKVTLDHRFFVYRDGKFEITHLRDLTIGDFIVGQTRALEHFSRLPETREEKLAELIGILCGAGNYGRDRDFRVWLDKRDHVYIDHVKTLLRSLWEGHYPLRKSSGSIGENSAYIDSAAKGPRMELLHRGLLPAARDRKYLPEWIFSACTSTRVAALRGLYDTDGGITSGYIQFTNISEHLATAFHLLCWSISVRTCIRQYGKVFRVSVLAQDAGRFLRLVRPVHEKKRRARKVSNLRLPGRLVKDVVNFVLSSEEWKKKEKVRLEVRGTVASQDTKWWNTYYKKANFSKLDVTKICSLRRRGIGCAVPCLCFLEKIRGERALELGVLCRLPWACIRKITPCGVKETMDIEIHSEDHSYASSGVLMHNSAADVVRLAMLYCDKSDKLKNCGVHMLSQVHDELIFECPKEHTQEAKEEIKYLMELPYKDKLDVALSADPGVGPNWLEAKG